MKKYSIQFFDLFCGVKLSKIIQAKRMTRENKIYKAIVTGGSAGIGKAIVEKLIDNGFIVAVLARTKSNLVKLKKEVSVPEACFIYPCDVSDKAQIEHSLQEVINELGDIDMLVNNAGVFIPGSIQTENDEVYEQTMKTNIDSAYYATKKIIPVIPKGGYIFNICSTASIIGYPNGGSYCISKFALLGLTKVLRQELMGKIAVSAILPGATYTNSWVGTKEPITRFIKPEDVAESLWSAWQIRKHTVMEEILLRPHLGDF
jgi:short-subunit dehydrogenase